ncbi:MAG: universal stress protein [Acidobacteriota bacterium]|nr:universal stress protein [Acidobacteriota bacterium]
MLNTPTRILVPTDFSPASNRALSLAKKMASHLDAEIHLLHVRVLLDDPSVDSEILDEVERILATSESATQDALERAGKNGPTTFNTHIERGVAAAPVIIDAVSEYDCDLVIMGTHGRRGLNRLLIGSVAQEVVHHSPVPVLTTRAAEGGAPLPRKILVAVDFSETSLEAVEWSADLAETLDAEITLLHVVEPLVYPNFYVLESPIEDRQDIKDHCLDSLSAIATERLAGVASTVAVTYGHVARAISTYAEENDHDLVVLATNGLTGLSHAVLGSVAESVVRLSKVPVLTVRGS